jgi:hypothetical protein
MGQGGLFRVNVVLIGVNLSVIPERFDECHEGTDKTEDIKSKSS